MSWLTDFLRAYGEGEAVKAWGPGWRDKLANLRATTRNLGLEGELTQARTRSEGLEGDKRALDIIDLRAIYHAVGDQLDRDELIRLGGLAYPEAAREFGELLDKIDRGEPLSV